MTSETKKNEKKSAVRLYAMPTTAEATARTEGYRFSRITAFYTLVYTDEEAPEGSIEVTEEDSGRLTAEDRQWLDDCQTTLVIEHIRAEKPKLIERLNELLETVEAIENEKMGEDKNDGDNAGTE